MATTTRTRTPRKTAAPPVKTAAPELSFLDGLEEPAEDTSKPTVDVSSIPEAIKTRVDDAFVEGGPWYRQVTASQEQTDAVTSAMRTYAENRPDGRVTLRVKPLVSGEGFRYKVVEFVARPRS